LAVVGRAMCGGERAQSALVCPMETPDLAVTPPPPDPPKYLLDDDEREIFDQLPLPPPPPPVFNVK